MKHVRREPPPPPPVDMKALLARIPEVRGRLNAAADALNKALMQVEVMLLGLRLGVYGGVPLPPEEYNPRPRFLSFVRDSKVWLLTVERPAFELKGRKFQADSEPLIGSSLATRKLAVDYLPALLDSMLEKAKVASDRVQNRTDALHAFIKNTQKLTGPEALVGRIDRAADELIARLQEADLDIDYAEDRVVVVDILSKYFLKP